MLFSQDVVLMRALRDMNLPKFVYDDVPLFLGLIHDLFPGLDCPRVRYPNFNDAVEDTLEKHKYILLPQQVTATITACLICRERKSWLNVSHPTHIPNRTFSEKQG